MRTFAASLIMLAASATLAAAQSAPGSGAYIGIGAGFGWGNSSQRDEVIPTPPPPPPVILDPELPADGSYRVRGASLGLAAGYGFVAGQLLYGFEGDINWSSIEGSSQVCGGDHKCGTSLEGYGTLRGRLGTFLGTSTLAYVTGGLAVGRINAYDVMAGGFEGTKTKAGWTVGAGLEMKLAPQWSAKLEYLYMDFGRDEYFTLPNRTPERVDLDVHTVRIGLNYSLSDPAPARTPLK